MATKLFCFVNLSSVSSNLCSFVGYIFLSVIFFIVFTKIICLFPLLLKYFYRFAFVQTICAIVFAMEGGDGFLCILTVFTIYVILWLDCLPKKKPPNIVLCAIPAVTFFLQPIQQIIALTKIDSSWVIKPRAPKMQIKNWFQTIPKHSINQPCLRK